MPKRKKISKEPMLLKEGDVILLDKTDPIKIRKEGEYVVYKTTFDGGGTGHGPHDVYPDGHHVYCELLEDHKVKVDFYQSGCFTGMIEDKKPIGKARRLWAVEKH